MKKVKFFLIVFFVMLVTQLIVDHIMRSSMDSAPAWLPYTVAMGCGLFSLFSVKLFYKGRAR